jgi:hypothetical protein
MKQLDVKAAPFMGLSHLGNTPDNPDSMLQFLNFDDQGTALVFLVDGV